MYQNKVNLLWTKIYQFVLEIKGEPYKFMCTVCGQHITTLIINDILVVINTFLSLEVVDLTPRAYLPSVMPSFTLCVFIHYEISGMEHCITMLFLLHKELYLYIVAQPL